MGVPKVSTLSQMKRKEQFAAYAFLSPYLTSTIVFTVGLLIFAFYISLHTWNLFQPPKFSGLQNYVKVFKSQDFWRSLLNVFWYSAIVVFFQTSIAIMLALLLFKPRPGKRLLRTLFYAPSVTSSVVIGMIFWWIFLKTGFANLFLTKFIGILGGSWEPNEWFNDPRGLFQLIASLFGGEISYSLWYFHGPSVTWMVIMLLAIYTTAPTFMIMYLAALGGIPSSLYESASIDGATPWTVFWKITLPMLKPITMMVVVLGTIGTIQMFDHVRILTAGGPLDTTAVPLYQIYTETLGILGPIRAGYGAAMAFILAIIIFAFTFLQRQLIEKGTEQY